MKTKNTLFYTTMIGATFLLSSVGAQAGGYLENWNCEFQVKDGETTAIAPSLVRKQKGSVVSFLQNARRGSVLPKYKARANFIASNESGLNDELMIQAVDGDESITLASAQIPSGHAQTLGAISVSAVTKDGFVLLICGESK